jgi:hypothetical protein
VVLFPIALIWLAVVFYFIIKRSLNEPEGEEQGSDPPRFRRPPSRHPRDGRDAAAARRSRTGSRGGAA